MNKNEFYKILDTKQIFIYTSFANKIFGLGKSYNFKIKIKKFLGLPLKNLKNINFKEFKKNQKEILYIVFNFFLENKIELLLKKKIRKLFSNKFSIGSYKYIQWNNNLPVNGQRTRTNKKTAQKLNRN